MNDGSRLAMLTRAEKMLAEAKTIPDLQDIIDMAEVARVAALESRLGSSAVNHATVIKIAAERRLADAVDEGQRRGQIAEPGKPSDSEHLATLGELDIKSARLAEARLLRDAYDEDALRARAEDASEQDRLLSRDRLLREARDKAAGDRKDDKAVRTAKAQKLPPNVTLHVGDFRAVLADVKDGSVDAIITDPPYPKEFLHLFGDLAEFADRVLTPDGVLAVMSGQTHLPAVFAELEGHRPYRWTIAYMTPGAGYASHARKVQSNWKPVLVYGKGPRFGDVVTSDASDKRLHEWGQDAHAFSELIERLTEPRHLVCDPFLGAGTTALAAVSLGRKFLGCDVSAEHVETTRQRLA